MSWMVYALLSRLIWACCNAIDQFTSRVHIVDQSRSALILNFVMLLPFSALAYALSDHTLVYTPHLLLIVGVGAVACVVAVLPYYKALQKDDVHDVAPFFEFTPVFLTIFAALVFGETMTYMQMFGGFVVVLCGFLFSWDFKHGHIKAVVLALMTLSCVLYAIFQLSLRATSGVGDVWGVIALYQFMQAVMGLALMAYYKSSRRSIIHTAIRTKGANIGFVLLNNALCFVSLYTLFLAFKLAPTTGHVAAFSGTQPFFCFFIMAGLGFVLPRYYKRMTFDRETRIKLALLLGIFGGIYLLVRR